MARYPFYPRSATEPPTPTPVAPPDPPLPSQTAPSFNELLAEMGQVLTTMEEEIRTLSPPTSVADDFSEEGVIQTPGDRLDYDPRLDRTYRYEYVTTGTGRGEWVPTEAYSGRVTEAPERSPAPVTTESFDPGWSPKERATFDAWAAASDLAPPARPVASESILDEANRLVHGERNGSYGHPTLDFRGCGRIWGALIDRWLRGELETHNPAALPEYDSLFPNGFPNIDARIVGLMMAGLKVNREAHQPKRDNLVDLAGYAETVAMVEAQQDAEACEG